jgi:hypothetical protein
LPLAGRDLTGANLSSADVRHVDFLGVILKRANLSYAWAKEASFFVSGLQGASLEGAQLEGASLYGAGLQGALLNNAQLQAASLDYAGLQDALLNDAQLQAASLDHAQLQGASLNNAQLHGATLDQASLQGAILNGANLQGARLDQANLQGAYFESICAWRADARRATWKDTWVAHPRTGPKADKKYTENQCGWTATTFAALKRLIVEAIPEGYGRSTVMERVEQRLGPTRPLEGEDEMAKSWAVRESEAPTPEVYEKSLAAQWRELGCTSRYALHGLIAQLSDALVSPFRDQSDAAKALAADFLNKDCPGAHGLAEDDKARLKQIAAPATPQAPKP